MWNIFALFFHCYWHCHHCRCLRFVSRKRYKSILGQLISRTTMQNVREKTRAHIQKLCIEFKRPAYRVFLIFKILNRMHCKRRKEGRMDYSWDARANDENDEQHKRTNYDASNAHSDTMKFRRPILCHIMLEITLTIITFDKLTLSPN